MDRSELIQTLTLWFVVLIFLQTASGASNSHVLDAIGIFGILLMYFLPLWILVEFFSDFVADQ